MISFFEAQLEELAIHRVGNKANNEFYVLSEQSMRIKDDLLRQLLMHYFSNPYEKVNEIYHFYHASEDLELNEVYHFVHAFFEGRTEFQETGEQLAKHLFECSTHPKIKSGELYIAHFNNVHIEGSLHDAIGIFKSENKETFLKVYPEGGGFGLDYDEEGININKLDKGCLVFKTSQLEGYKVAVIDNTNRSTEAVYWKDDFLKLKIRNDNYHQTSNVLGVYKNFVTQKMDEEFEVSKADKIDLLNKSMKYFKEKETFDIDDFSNEVIGDPQGISLFKNYKKNFEDELDTPIADTFDISGAAVKKQARIYKSVLKLDKNFHIYIHGNKELIEKGFDEGKSMNYYKVYFKEEQ